MMTNEEVKAHMDMLIAHKDTALETHPYFNRCDSCIHSEEWNGSNCYECVKGMADNFETQPTDVDCISREAMLSLQTEYAEKMGATTFWKLRDDIRALPPVTPTNEEIKEAYLKGYDYGVKDWFKSKTQPCEDAISREAVQDLISIWLSDYLLDETREALETINYKVGDMPSVYPERPKGEWLHIYKSDIACECSVCHIQMPITEYFHYCPNCGSNMSGGGEDDLKT